MIHNNVPNSDSQQHNSIAVQKIDELVSNAIAAADNKSKVKLLKTDRQVVSYIEALKNAIGANLLPGTTVKLQTPVLKLTNVVTGFLKELPRPINDVSTNLNLQWVKYKTTNEYCLMINSIVAVSQAHYPKEHFFDKGVTRSPVVLMFDDFCFPESAVAVTPVESADKVAEAHEIVKEAIAAANDKRIPIVTIKPNAKASGESAEERTSYTANGDPGSDSSYVYDDDYKSKFLNLLLISIQSLNGKVYAQARELVSPFKLHPTHERVIMDFLELQRPQYQQQPFTSFAQIPSHLQLTASTVTALKSYSNLVKDFTAPRNVIVKDQIAKALEVFWLTYLSHLDSGLDPNQAAAQQHMQAQANAQAEARAKAYYAGGF